MHLVNSSLKGSAEFGVALWSMLSPWTILARVNTCSIQFLSPVVLMTIVSSTVRTIVGKEYRAT